MATGRIWHGAHAAGEGNTGRGMVRGTPDLGEGDHTRSETNLYPPRGGPTCKKSFWRN